jgi:glycerate-2-kinase
LSGRLAAASVIGPFPWDPFPPSGEPDPKGPDPVQAIAFRAAVTSADAYRSVRLALRREGGTLRVGNRFVSDARYRQVAFLAFGNAANSMALAALHAVGDRLTQGFLAGPEPILAEIPFRGIQVAPGWGGAPEAESVVAAATELAGDLSEQDLLLILLSAGAVRSLLRPPAGMSVTEFGTFLREAHRRGASGAEVGLLSRVLGEGAVAGRLARVDTHADIATFVIDRGDGARLLGGGPMHPLGPNERAEGAQVLARIGLSAVQSPSVERIVGSTEPAPLLPARVSRAVVVANPGDALKAAADAVFDKGWTSRLAALALPGGPADAAAQFLSRADDLYVAEGLTTESRTKGVGAFAMTTLGLPEGIDEGPALGEFLSAARDGLRRREMSVGLFRTAGPIGAPEYPAGAVVGAPTETEQAVRTDRARVVAMRRGITDVGFLAVALVPAPLARTPAPGRT